MFLLSFPFEDEGWVWPLQLFNRTQGHTLHSVEIILLDKKRAAAAESSFNTVDLEAQNLMLFFIFQAKLQQFLVLIPTAPSVFC